jgi:hypothetical protein
VHCRASPGGLAAAVMCLALVLTVCGTAGADGSRLVTDLAFDVTIIEANVTCGWHHYAYTVRLGEQSSGGDVGGWYLTGAFGIDPSSITHQDYGGYGWRLGEVVQPGGSPSGAPGAGLFNNTNTPVIWWVRDSLSGSGTDRGVIGTFEFDSPNAPTSRAWLAHSDETAYATGSAAGPTPELSPLLLMLGQGVPILGWIAARRRSRS